MSDLGIRNVRLAPDGSKVTWLGAGQDGPRVLDLWSLDVATGRSQVLVRAADLVAAAAERLTDEEKARRERLRLGDVGGIVEYAWSPNGGALLFPLGGHLYLVNLTAAGPRSVRLTSEPGEVTDAQVSPRGGYASYVRDRHLWVVDLSTSQTRRLSDELGPHEFAGAAEFIAQEEMHRFSGYWWSPDDRAVAYTVVDEAPVTIAKRIEVYAERFETIEQRYPYAGGRNARVRLCVAPLQGAKTLVQLPPYEYLARVDWDLEGNHLYVQTESREQTTLVLSKVDARTGASRTLLTEHDAAWINLHNDFRSLPGGDVLWASERSGYKHLELRGSDGQLRRQLTSGPWEVLSVRAVDQVEGVVYFDGFKESPLELHLYSVGLYGDEASPRLLTNGRGWHEATVSARGKLWVDVFSTPELPPTIRLYKTDGTQLADLGEKPKPRRASAPQASMTFGSFIGPDGTELYYRLRRPKGFRPGRRYPAVVHVYGGPGACMVQQRYLPRQEGLESRLCEAGFVVFAMDNRGSPHRGKRFESVLKHRFGGAELEDQTAGARWLAAQEFVAAERIGIFGASYGGFMTLTALLRAPTTFKVGVSIAPVTEWGLYDTHYTERYLGTPQEQADAYARSGVLDDAAKLQGKLLMIHGMADDNVLYTHSTKMYKALQTAGKLFDIMVYPGEKHGITGASAREHEVQSIVTYFKTHL